MLIRSLVSGAVLAAVILVYAGVRGHLDLNTAVLVVVFSLAFGALDSLLNRRQDPARPGRTLRRQPEGRGLLILQSAGNGAAMAVVLLVMFGVLGDLDGETVVLCLVFGALSGTLDYFRNRGQNRSAATEQAHGDATVG